MTGGIGTWRYMAPEVVRHQKYTEKASDTNEHLGLETPLILRCVNCVTFRLLKHFASEISVNSVGCVC